jgi:coenzyme F420-reducing hydrogenase delta subunit
MDDHDNENTNPEDKSSESNENKKLIESNTEGILEEKSPGSKEGPNGGIYHPKIIGFLCNWCTYAGADLAGVSRYQYPTDIRVIRVMCSTRMDPMIILETLQNGADGIFIGGCHLGDCHYISGNYHTIHKMDMTKQLIEMAGLDKDRVRLEWISASEGQRFANIIMDFTEDVKRLGPSPISASLKEEEKDKKMLRAVKIAKNTSMSFRLRSVIARIKKSVDEGNVYGEKVQEERFEQLMKQIIKDEYIRSGILMSIEKEPKTVEEISDEIGIPTEVVFKNIARLWKMQAVLPDGHKGLSPTYVGGMI